MNGFTNGIGSLSHSTDDINRNRLKYVQNSVIILFLIFFIVKIMEEVR